MCPYGDKMNRSLAYYLSSCSENALENYQLAEANRIALLRKEIEERENGIALARRILGERRDKSMAA